MLSLRSNVLKATKALVNASINTKVNRLTLRRGVEVIGLWLMKMCEGNDESDNSTVYITVHHVV